MKYTTPSGHESTPLTHAGTVGSVLVCHLYIASWRHFLNDLWLRINCTVPACYTNVQDTVARAVAPVDIIVVVVVRKYTIVVTGVIAEDAVLLGDQ